MSCWEVVLGHALRIGTKSLPVQYALLSMRRMRWCTPPPLTGSPSKQIALSESRSQTSQIANLGGFRCPSRHGSSTRLRTPSTSLEEVLTVTRPDPERPRNWLLASLLRHPDASPRPDESSAYSGT